MRIIADLHIHSHYSLATSKDLTPESLAWWAQRKGITVLATGDASHPGWLQELAHKLDPAEDGLFTLKKEFQKPSSHKEKPMRFILSTEISCIYKKKGKVRKIHVLLYAPTFQCFRSLHAALQSRGYNITSDGRPILGMDVHDLFELCLSISPDFVLIPAHIWTPWFSALGASSGFDSINDCFEDLTSEIFAVETGLSSDPPMNWLCSSLDRFTLVSNSDAHSPEKIGREATLLDTELSYAHIMNALRHRTTPSYQGTIEFFPEEGKYHYDGHRLCNVSLNPFETLKNKKLCPHCGKPVTIGVLHRVAHCADRTDYQSAPHQAPFYSVIPLKEIIAECSGKRTTAKSVTAQYHALLEIKTEFEWLLWTPYEECVTHLGDSVAQALRNMRERKIRITEGYDGEFGIISVCHRTQKEHPFISFDVEQYQKRAASTRQ